MIYKIYVINLIILLIFSVATTSHKIYYIENKKFLNWDAASQECKRIGLNLLSIRTSDEFDYLKEYIKTNYGRIFPYWIGAYRVNGQFQWTATGEEIKQFFWHAGEPNDKSGKENCVHTWEEDFDWNDNDCERELPFICDLDV